MLPIARLLTSTATHDALRAAQEGAHAVTAQGSEAAAGAAHAAEHVPTGGAIFTHLYHHVLAEPVKWMPVEEGSFLATFAEPHEGRLQIPIWFNLQYFQIGGMVLVFLAFLWALAGLRSRRPNRVQRTLSGFVLWIRDEMAVPALGRHHAHTLLPLFLTAFFFVTVSNLMGLFPFGSTATSCVFVTAGMALVTFATMIIGGMIANGPVKFWVGLVPHGVPLALWPLMFVIEIIGLLVKPFALTIRLFANMTGGHLVVLSFMGLIFFFGQAELLGKVTYVIAPFAVGFSVFIMIIEAFVALLQAYIFTLLSMLFVGSCLHPEH